MDLPMNATVSCADGTCGRSTAILLNPINNQITHLVVQESGMFGTARMVPTELVTDGEPEMIRLRCTKAELAEMPPFVTTHYIPAPAMFLPGYETGVMLWPYVSMMQPTGVKEENTPVDELAIHRGAHVSATDGRIGQVEEFVIDPVHNGVTHIVLREGHFWGRHDVTIPVERIDHIDSDTVYLKLNKIQVSALPAVAMQRHA